MERITRKRLERQLARINKNLEAQGAPLWSLDYARVYGGYQITFEKSAHTITPRMPGYLMHQWLDGAGHMLWSLTHLPGKG